VLHWESIPKIYAVIDIIRIYRNKLMTI